MTELRDLAGVREYYGKVLKTNKDLRTSACCPIDAMPPMVREAAAKVHPEVLEKFYGCGSPIPYALDGKTVVDLGSGSGRDAYILSALVGEQGRVIGVDMTPEQIAVAKRHVSYHQTQYGYKNPNVEFRHGYIEDLKSADIADSSVDIVVSNCVINLSPNKERVFSEILRVLKPGGELFFSDIFASRRIPKNLAQHDIFVGECLGGALYVEDFRRLLLNLGVADYRILSRARVDIADRELADLAGLIEFTSMTLRAFKLPLEDRCEDFGQIATYLGGIPFARQAFVLDDHHIFERGKGVPVCGNTAKMLSETRYGSYFNVAGSTDFHFGLFDCTSEAAASAVTSSTGACC
jgi:SAM-dependent methyltransferase